ncbi:MAG TPA: hypothetical protein VGS57_08580 [Thermoanaerobaculia bacterium]|jgi:hypothetical protein|nr:hypothetical protein [Thermoanaerobaculia bacterium]
MAEVTERRYKPATWLSEHYTTLLVGFLVGVPFALAPLWSRVPGVESLLDLFPGSSRNTLISFSGFLLSGMAMIIEFLAKEQVTPTAVKRYFRRILWPLGIGFALLFVFYGWFVKLVPVEQGKKRYAFVLASRIHGPPCGCRPTDPDVLCVQQLGVGNEAAIPTCWDADAIQLRTVLLQGSYLVSMGSAGALVGAIMLQRKSRRRTKRLPRATPSIV